MLCLFIIVKMEFIYKNVLMCYFWEENYTGETTEIFEINLLRTMFVYNGSAVNSISAAHTPFYFIF